MIAADLRIAAASLGLAVSFLLDEPGIWLIYVVLAIRSLGTAFHWPAIQASIPLIVPPEQTPVRGCQEFNGVKVYQSTYVN